MKKNIILTGASGFVGSYLLEKLLNDDRFNIILLLRSKSNLYRIKKFLSQCKAYYIDNTPLEEIFKQN